MKTKTSLIKLLRIWGVVFLAGIGASIIILDIFTSYRDFHSRANRLRADYIDRQKMIIKQQVDHIIAMIDYEKKRTEAVTRETIQARVNEAYAIAQHIYEQHKDSRGEAEIQPLIIEALRPIRFAAGTGYYFATRLDGVELLFADQPAMEGVNLYDVQDTHGKYVVKDMIAIARRSGEGFCEYHWTKPGVEGNDFKKISFVKYFAPLGCFIGAGLYVDDVEASLQKQLLARINKIRFGVNGYIFVNDWHGVSLAHGLQPEIIGRDMWENEDSKGNKVTQLLRAASQKQDGGYVEYWWRKPATGKESPKIAYARSDSDWKWTVGAGIYIDDVDADIALLQAQLNRHIRDKTLFSIMLILGIVALFFLLLQWLSRRLENDFQLFLAFFGRAALADEEISRDQVHFDELDRLAENANRMLRDKMEAGQALLAEREKLLVTLRTIGDGLITTDTFGNVVLLNRVAEQLTGWTNEEARGKALADILQLVNAQTGEKAANPVDRVLEKGVVVGLANHTKLIARDHREYQIADSAAPITGADGRIAGVVLVFRDVTEEYRLRGKIAASERRLRAVFNQTYQFMGLLSPAGKLLAVNQAALLSFNLQEEEVLGRWFWDCPWWTHDAALQAWLQQAIARAAAGESTHAEVNHRHPDGHLLTFDFSLKPLLDPEGRVELLIAEGRDISARKKTEQQLRASETLFRSLVEHAPSGIFLVNDRFQCIYANQLFCRMLGYPEDELLGMDFRNWVDESSRELVVDRYRRRQRGETVEPRYEILVVRKDGSRFPAEIIPSVFKGEEGETRTLAQVIDISDLKKQAAEKEKLLADLRRAKNLESLGTLAGGIAHDFNNLLTGVFGNISLAEMKLPPDEATAKPLTAAQRALERARSLTNQLLTFAKGGSPVIKPQDIRQVIAETAAFNLAGSKAKLVTCFAADTWKVLADKGQISQVVANLVLNADQAMPDGGTVEISTANVVVAADEDPLLSPGAYVKITVQDQGVGIPKAQQEKIFDPYFTTKQAGSGLGLATVYSIIRKHQGHIRVASTPAQGTLFTIHLPADTSGETPELQDDSPTKTAKAEFSQPWKILVMDDEEIIREVAVEMLALLGCTAETANDGREAISRYREALAAGKAFDLVILDLTIPGGMGGEEAVRELLTIDPGARVVVSSGYSSGRVVAHYRDFGFVGKLSKPYNLNELRQLLAKLSPGTATT